MSTYVDKASNPKTRKVQSAIFIDDFYGHYRYGVAFRKDGLDAKFDDLKRGIDLTECEIYPLEEIKVEPDKRM